MTDRLVPTQYADIVTAIAAADPNDNIILEAIGSPFTGANNKNIDPGGVDYVIKGETLEPADCVIDCENAGRAFHYHTGETSATIISCLTVENGNWSTDKGGGIYCDVAAPIISHCIFRDCTAKYGGAIYAYHCVPAIKNCLIMGSASTSFGGAVCFNGGSSFIGSCTIVDNSGAGATDGAIFVTGTATPQIKNNILWGNVPGHQIRIANGNATIGHCDIQGMDIDGVWTDAGDNINTDPLFEADGYHLRTGSPCIDAGDNTSVDWLYDINGDDRIQDGTVDMGVDEVTPIGGTKMSQSIIIV